MTDCDRCTPDRLCINHAGEQRSQSYLTNREARLWLYENVTLVFEAVFIVAAGKRAMERNRREVRGWV